MEARTWTLAEARKILPHVIQITTEAHARFTELYRQVEERILPENQLEEKEDAMKRILAEWTEEVQALGAEIKGLWLVDFDHGAGYYCWRLGESELLFEHTYEAGFAGRRPIEEDDD